MLSTVARRADVRLAALWLALAAGLAFLATRVVDWYVMTDELLYERLAISSAHSHSPLPRIHGELIGNVNQLYPLLLAPLFRDTLVPSALHDAHVLNGILMSSAAIPAFLLALRVTQSRRLATLVAVLSVAMPWIVLSSFLMTEVVAYPAFVWAMLALQHAIVSPRARNDALLLAALGVAILARTQFAALLVVVPLVLVAHGALERGRVREALRGLVSAHRPLAWAYAALGVLALALLATGRLSSVLGTYSVTAEGNLLPSGTGSSLLAHLAPLGLGMGVVPFILGVAWLLTALRKPGDREQHVFALMTAVTTAVLIFEVTSFDLRFGQGRLHGRYVFYAVPLLLIAFAAVLRDGRWSKWPVVASGGLLAVAFSFVPVKGYDKLNVDSPVTVLDNALLAAAGSEHGAQLLLGFVAVLATLLLVTLHRRRLVAPLLALAVLAIPAQTALAFTRLLTVDGTSGRPITLDQGVVFDWVDRQLGPNVKVTMLPYPSAYGNYWENVAYWWNVEFWNESVQRAAVYEGAFTGTPETFPTTQLSFDRSTGRANTSPSRFSLQAVAESRFRLAGKVLGEDRGVALIENELPWRAQWLAFDLYRDGWTIPRIVGTIRIFAPPGQTGRTMRYLTVAARGPDEQPPRTFLLRSNADGWQGRVDPRGTSTQIAVCVPARGFADVKVDSPTFTPIYGDPRSEESFGSYARSGGVLVTGIALADETNPC